MSVNRLLISARSSILLFLVFFVGVSQAFTSLSETADPLIWRGNVEHGTLTVDYRKEQFILSLVLPSNTDKKIRNQKYDDILTPLFLTHKPDLKTKLPLLPFVNKRWDETRKAQVVNSLIYGAKESSKQQGSDIAFQVVISWPLQSLKMRLSQWLPMILRHSKDWGINPALTLAVIHQESLFKAYARSNAPAYGLMQITPDMAGRDVARLLNNTNKKIPEYLLFDPEFNLMIGIAYLHYLDTKYFSKVKDSKSRMLCSIAAYNGGMGHVKKLFAKKYADFNANINKLTSQEVEVILMEQHPFKETRDYVRKVYGHYQSYQKIIKASSS